MYYNSFNIRVLFLPHMKRKMMNILAVVILLLVTVGPSIKLSGLKPFIPALTLHSNFSQILFEQKQSGRTLW